MDGKNYYSPHKDEKRTKHSHVRVDKEKRLRSKAAMVVDNRFKYGRSGNNSHRSNTSSATNYSHVSNCYGDSRSRAHGNCEEVASSINWEHYKNFLSRIFFTEQDAVRRGTPEYDDCWAFVKKYQMYQKQNGIGKVVSLCYRAVSELNLPMKYDRSHRMNFSVITGNVDDDFFGRFPINYEDAEDVGLSRELVIEFRQILLLYLDFCQKQKFAKLKKLRNSQKNLPMALYRDTLVETLKENQVVILAGDTGCGKSTQVPQYLLEAGYDCIACTQPRRIACISLCKRVAFETLNEYKSEVGYQIRFEKNKTQHTRILFLTEGLLLRQIATDPLLSSYSVIVLDEVHERHLHGDFLLGVVKCLVRQRPDLKVVLMSATINLNLFQRYFWNAPIIQVPGRLYPIDVAHCPISGEEQTSRSQRFNAAPYVRILDVIDKKYTEDERGDLLIFLSGMTEISTVVESIQEYALQTQRWIVLPLHSTLSIAEQDKVFDMAPDGVRKCIVSTNIAETSVTIDGIRFVADSGKVKEMNYDPACKMQRLQEFWISKASAEQRKGRAGRTGPGVCYRMFSEADYSAMADYATPEIHRVPLDCQILQMIALGLPDVRKFPFIEPPSSASVEEAILSLKDHGAITNEEKLTPIGRMLSSLPVDITIGKILIMGSLFGQLEPVFSLASALSVQSPFTNRSYRDSDISAARRNLESDHGDPFTLLNAYNKWLDEKSNAQSSSRQWCKRLGLEEQRFYEMTKLRKQFQELLKDSGLVEMNSHRNWENMSSLERSQRHGELKRLRDMKREFLRAPKKRKILQVNFYDPMAVSEDENETDVRDIDFKLQNDDTQVKQLSQASKNFTYKDLFILKIILCSGLYPQFSLADEHNSYKAGTDQLFHTKVKPFVVLHPMGVFANQPHVLQLNDSDILEFPGIPSRQPFSSRHQLIVYMSLLETTKPYLMNTMRVSAIQTLLLFGRNIDTNHDFSRIVFDAWLEVKFPQPTCGQDLVMQAVEIRKLWESVLWMKLNKENCSSTLQLSRKLISFLHEETFYSVKRLLAADVKELYVGPESSINIPSMFGNAKPHMIKGGMMLNEYITYSCLCEENGSSKANLETLWQCSYCKDELNMTILERMSHSVICRENAEKLEESSRECVPGSSGHGRHKQEYFCNDCRETLYLSNTEILKHRKSHLD